MKTKKISMRNTLLVSIILYGISACNFTLSAQGKEGPADKLLLNDWRPVSLYKIPVNHVEKAFYPAIDVHAHDYAKTDKDVQQWIKDMDACGIEKTIILSFATGPKFDSIYHKYAKYGKRFEIWCGFDYNGYDKPGYGPAAVKELERCYKVGARGVGEEGDKGLGLQYSEPVKAWGMHFDDPRMKPLFKKCAELKMPVNIHVTEPIWFYEELDAKNDGLMESQRWFVDMSKPGIIGFDALIQTLENAVKDNPKTKFIAAHYANLNHDMEKLADLLDKYPNFYADISARFEMAANIPRYMKDFFEKYQDRLLYGTDMGRSISRYRATFRVLETNDEHFYDFPSYKWAQSGIGLPKEILKKVYRDNAVKILRLK